MRPAQERVLIPSPTPQPPHCPPRQTPAKANRLRPTVWGRRPNRAGEIALSNRAGRIAPVESRFQIAPSKRAGRIAPTGSRRLNSAGQTAEKIVRGGARPRCEPSAVSAAVRLMRSPAAK